MSFLVIRTGPKFASVTYTDVVADNTAKTTYTFSGRSISTASTDRKIVVSVVSQDALNNPTISSLTIGGISASQVVSLSGTPSSNDYLAALWQATVPTGTTADIVVTFTNPSSNCGIGIWAVYGAAAGAADTGSSAADPAAVSLDIPADGIAIGAHQGSASPSFTWTNLTENFDGNVSGTINHSGASASFTSIQTNLTITSDQSAGATTDTMVVAS